ncbi:Wadjet anti-phage system protein JetD domain-containing protein [Reyranella sp. CPCC 100927]|uniref:Wadjet anti-phage system protein JetD domain-containing protein n=1 Tax=Reyranella sp. CPCC 100927 TaxID=2599616 RepID=UPI0011B5FFC3|nr:Wadjet anti-phage system protein JetD domain-containing protein [Reyranella sp. CPCC 100927]TWS99844.1 hypothetical protein FQU96_34150 [Reyranella sp. CPCC 100927]
MGLEDPGIAFLKRLLVLSERSPDRTRQASAAPDYDSLPRAEAITRFQSQLAAAERAGAVALRYGKRERKHLIERVTVRDQVILARHLGRTPAPEAASEARGRLKPVIQDGEPWLTGILDEMQGRWMRGEPAYRLGADDIEGAKEFLALLCAISRGQARGLDARTFALSVTGDTKAFDRNASRLLAVLAAHFNETSADAVWTCIGLDRYPHPVHLRGPLLIEDGQRVLVDGMGKPFASIHPEMLSLLKLALPPPYILTIENYASFNRHVRELDDGGLVIYTGGFASVGVMALLKCVLGCTDAAVPFCHWGDIDPGGLRIFRYLEETLPRPPRPHLMSRELAEAQGRPASPDPSLASIAQTPSAVAPLAQWLARGEGIRHLEQEAINPTTPTVTSTAA